MASPKSVDDGGFRARVAKVFGSLSSSSSSSPWSLTGEMVEKREWSRYKDHDSLDDETPCSSSFDGLFRKTKRRNRKDLLDEDSENLDEDDEDDRNDDDGGCRKKKPFGTDDGDDDDREEWDIRSSIGLDPTLDNEEEEDEYDKFAEGSENTGDRLYMKNVTNHGQYLNSHNVLPSAVEDAPNSCANQSTEGNAMEEDESVGESNWARDKSVFNAKKPCLVASEGGFKPKSILKRKEEATVRSSKRVRFDSACKDESEERLEKNQVVVTGTPSVETKTLDEGTSRVPDYVLHPNNYVRYSFDSFSDIDEVSNTQACMDALEPIRRSNSIMLEHKLEAASTDCPKSVTFIPRKKTVDDKVKNTSCESKQNEGDSPEQCLTQDFALGIAAGEVQQDEVGVVGEDEMETDTTGRSVGSQKPGRHYRTKSSLEDS